MEEAIDELSKHGTVTLRRHSEGEIRLEVR
jgi:hypothetical protein